MEMFENGGANAIKGFNYQKSVIVLIAVLHHLSSSDFQIHVESEDDIVVTMGEVKTYIQVKSSDMGVAALTKQEKGKKSIIEKNLANGDEKTSSYKLVTPKFSFAKKHLIDATAAIITNGADIYSYSEDAIEEIKKRIAGLPALKLSNSRVALTTFRANQKDSLNYIIGIMAQKGIPVDNSHGMASLKELCLQIDQRSEIPVQQTEDYAKKVFTKNDLQNIFNYSDEIQYYNDIVSSLGYPMMRQVELKKKNATIGAIYGSYVNLARERILKIDTMNMESRDVIDYAIEQIAFTPGVDELEQEAVVINAFSKVLFERSQA